MILSCRLCRQALCPFHVFPRKALYTKPVAVPIPDAVADMELGYCPTCRHISALLRTKVSGETLRRTVYGQCYAGYPQMGFSPLQQMYTDFVADWLVGHLSAGGRILEIGCHDGYLLSRLAARGYACEGCEPSPYADAAREKYGLAIKKDFFHRDLFGQHEYDAVIIRHVLEHVEDPVALLADAVHVLKEHGLLYVEVPNSYGSLERSYLPEFHADHLSYFTMASLLCLLDMCGMRQIVHQESVLAYMRFPFLNVLGRKGSAAFTEGVRTARWLMDFRIPHLLNEVKRIHAVYLRNLGALAGGQRLAVWGTGSIGTQYAIDANWSLSEVCYVDINPRNQDLVLSVTGHRVEAPECIRRLLPACVLIASGWEEDVRKQLRPYVQDGTRIVGFDDLLVEKTGS